MLFSKLCQKNSYNHRAFSDLFGKFLVPMKLGKNCVILGKSMIILGKNSAIFSKIGKVYLLNWDFSANLECSRSIGIFFSQLGKIWYRKPDPVLYREKALNQFDFVCFYYGNIFCSIYPLIIEKNRR